MLNRAERFPRQALFSQAAMFEARLQNLAAEVSVKIDEAENLGLGQVTNKLATRWQQLRDAADIARDLRIHLSQLK